MRGKQIFKEFSIISRLTKLYGEKKNYIQLKLPLETTGKPDSDEQKTLYVGDVSGFEPKTASFDHLILHQM